MVTVQLSRQSVAWHTRLHGRSQLQVNGSDGLEVVSVGAPTLGQVLTIVDGLADVDRALKAAASCYEGRGYYRAVIVD